MSTIGSTTPTNPASLANATGDGFGRLKTDEFVEIIFSELQNQDPLQPNDSQALLEQLSSIRSIQSDIELADRMDAIAAQGQLTEAAAMIGRFVSGLDENSERVADWVGSVSRTDGGIVLNLTGGQRVPIGQIDEVLDGDDAHALLEQLIGGGDDDETEDAGEAQG